MITVFNPLRDTEIQFDDRTDPEYAVIYAYITEETDRSSEFFHAVHAKTLDEFKTNLPITRGSKSVACGDWMCKVGG